jgi:hypothetical protein
VVIGNSTSDWVQVTSGVPQGTVLGPLLFSVFVDDLDSIIPAGIQIKKFADDTKIYAAFRSTDGPAIHLKLQQTLDFLFVWCTSNSLPVNISKCNVIHLGRNNPNYQYTLNSVQLIDTTTVKDLGIMLDSSLTFVKHVDSVASKARRLMGLVFRTFRSRRSNVLVPLYKTLVRPIMEFATPVWNTLSLRNARTVERVQRCFTKRIDGMHSKCYTERLYSLKLSPLSQRRTFFDLVHVYKVINGLLISNCSITPRMNLRCTRGHSQMLRKLPFSTNCRRFFFSLRIVNDWNALPSEVVNSRTLENFKFRLRKHLNLC